MVRLLLGEMSQLLVDGQRVIPTRTIGAGFAFKHPNLGEALTHLLGSAASRSIGPVGTLKDAPTPP